MRRVKIDGISTRAGFVLALFAVLAAACAGSPSGSHRNDGAQSARRTPGGRWVMGYYPGYQRDLMPPDEIDWAAMTHIAVARVVPRPDGSLDTTFDIDEREGPIFAKDLAKRARANGVVPILMVGGAGEHDGFAAAASGARQTLVTNLLSSMRDYGFEGLELDWEPVVDADEAPLTALVDDLRTAAPKAVLTFPLAETGMTFPAVSPMYGRLARQLDQLNIMSYAQSGVYDGWKTWHSSALDGATTSTPISIAVDVKSYLDAGVPANKLGVGIGFFGQCWTGGVTGPRQDFNGAQIVAADNDMSYTNIMSEYFDKAAYHYDDQAQAPYLGFSAPKGQKQCTYISYEDADSIATKGKWAAERGLGGAIVWTINQAHVLGAAAGKTDPLLRVVRDAFQGSAPAPVAEGAEPSSTGPQAAAPNGCGQQKPHIATGSAFVVDGTLKVPVIGRCFVDSDSEHGQPIYFDVRDPVNPASNKAESAGIAKAGADGGFRFDVAFGAMPADCGRTMKITAREDYNDAGRFTPVLSNLVEFTTPSC